MVHSIEIDVKHLRALASINWICCVESDCDFYDMYQMHHWFACLESKCLHNHTMFWFITQSPHPSAILCTSHSIHRRWPYNMYQKSCVWHAKEPSNCSMAMIAVLNGHHIFMIYTWYIYTYMYIPSKFYMYLHIVLCPFSGWFTVIVHIRNHQTVLAFIRERDLVYIWPRCTTWLHNLQHLVSIPPLVAETKQYLMQCVHIIQTMQPLWSLKERSISFMGEKGGVEL